MTKCTGGHQDEETELLSDRNQQNIEKESRVFDTSRSLLRKVGKGCDVIQHGCLVDKQVLSSKL